MASLKWGIPAVPVTFLLSTALIAVSLDAADMVYERGYEVKTVLDGNQLELGFYKILFFQDNKDYALVLDSTHSRFMGISVPFSQGSQIDEVAGSVNNEAGYRDGDAKFALFNHPTDIATDEDGHIYVAEVRHAVIRKISSAGFVTTIAGVLNKTGHVDGSGETALLSNDFGITYVPSSCSLAICDRGNRVIRSVQLKQETKCRARKNSSFSFGALLQAFINWFSIVSALLLMILFVLQHRQSIFENIAALPRRVTAPCYHWLLRRGESKSFTSVSPCTDLLLDYSDSIEDQRIFSKEHEDVSDSLEYESLRSEIGQGETPTSLETQTIVENHGEFAISCVTRSSSVCPSESDTGRPKMNPDELAYWRSVVPRSSDHDAVTDCPNVPSGNRRHSSSQEGAIGGDGIVPSAYMEVHDLNEAIQRQLEQFSRVNIPAQGH